ncbi:sarcosine oxidase subunit alpha family protein [Frigidibacter oleivorans]|uniref:sarcosine oxidase subunit alpha family protein n=1 Tax=Frigidibacter oleivorans TaxID=2487129 RepID=UPI000F8CFB72|nr:sarcosine oxidase subunit alpha family protein [Frigidibacter oleivorans]
MRIEGKGLIDRSQTLGFRFDGVEHVGFEGDTLASALLASGQRLIGRSFKYHRPRGLVFAGSEEPNGLVTVRRDGAGVPNVRATMQELHQGLEADSQNRWPSLRFDAMQVNDLFAPFLGAGFYYKTFMWPRAFWEGLYEPLIRRAAGLGRLPQEPEVAPYEKVWAHCDLLVIGAGPAGIMAALTAARAGADVILADEDARPGGRLLAETHEVGGQPGPAWVAAAMAELRDLGVRVMPRTTVTGAYDDGTFGALERVALHLARPGDLPREAFWRIVARRAVLAAGAQERLIAFPGNDRPGVMAAGAVRAYLNRWGVAAGSRVAVFTNNDDGHRTARDLHAAGIEVTALIDARADARLDAPFQVLRGAKVLGTEGRLALKSVTVETDHGTRRVPADCLAVSGGWNPAVHLACHHGARPWWREEIAAFVPPHPGKPGTVPGLIPCGAAAGVFSTAGCLADGQRAGLEALAALDRAGEPAPLPEAEDAPVRVTPLWEVRGEGRAFLDMANDVTTKDVRLAATEGFTSVEHMKRYTTQGMALDQGRGSNVAALAVLAEATGQSVPATGTTTYRPPFTPVSIAAMGAGGRGKGFAPERLTTSHRAALDRLAPMIEAGLWYRPSHFPRTGEPTWKEACDREVATVRSRVGICDVSTLGKIDVQGPDAAAFLDFVYTNTMSTLSPGRVRYGLMLREDGMVMDDGTCARLGEGHFLITTTTAAAGQVMRHLDFVAQALRPDLDLRAISVTEAWAQFAVTGPKARRLLDGILDQPLDEMAFMACRDVQLHGVAARLFRISFSGEEGYEVAVPARYGNALYRDLVARAEAMGGCAYGMEALNVLRIEKGFLTHAELHGRTTAFDLGLQGLMSRKKDFIGRAASERPGLSGPDRQQLVGLKATGRGDAVLAGAHLFPQGAEPVPMNDLGYVTSACWSPTLGLSIGLGFLRDGRTRHGERLQLLDSLRGVDVTVEVTAPVFYDPDGVRMRG